MEQMTTVGGGGGTKDGSSCMLLYDQSPHESLKAALGIIALVSSANSLGDALQTSDETTEPLLSCCQTGLISQSALKALKCGTVFKF